MSPDTQILAPPGAPREPADPRRWLTLVIVLAAAHAAASRAGGGAVRRDFAASLVRTLWFQAGVFGLGFLLMLLLAAGAGRRPAAPDGPVAVPQQARAAAEGVTA